MIEHHPAAIFSLHPSGLVSLCAWHNDTTPGSVEEGTAWAKARGLEISHGVCPCCFPRVVEAMRREVSTLIVNR